MFEKHWCRSLRSATVICMTLNSTQELVCTLLRVYVAQQRPCVVCDVSSAAFPSTEKLERSEIMMLDREHNRNHRHW